MTDVYIRIAYLVIWLVIVLLMLMLGKMEVEVKPYVYGLLFTPAVNIVFYACNISWRLGLIEIPFGFFSDLSAYRTVAVAVNFLIILITALTISWIRHKSSSLP